MTAQIRTMSPHLHRETDTHTTWSHSHSNGAFCCCTLTDLVSYSRFTDTLVRHLSTLILALIVILIVVVVSLLQYFVSLTWRLIGFINVLGAFTDVTFWYSYCVCFISTLFRFNFISFAIFCPQIVLSFCQLAFQRISQNFRLHIERT